MDIKQVALNHVEKAIFGIVMVFVLLGLISTNWSHYEGTPDEIVDKVETGEKNLEANKWPEDEREKYLPNESTRPEAVVYREVFKPINVNRYELTGEIVRDPTPNDEPLREPSLLTLKEPIVTTARVFIEVQPAEDESEEGDTESQLADATDADVDDGTLDEFLKREPTDNAMGAAGGEYGGGLYQDYAAELTGAYEQDMTMAPGYEGEYADYLGEGTGGGMSLPTKNGQGYHFASVRAVFPLREQIRNYAEATNRSFHEASLTFDILDFELQRQTMQPGANPWPDDENTWETVDLNVARDVLANAAGYEPDVVNGMVTNNVITMPLPMRVSGKWKRQATHPRIKNFELSDEQMKFEVEMNRKMLMGIVEEEKAIRESETPRGGFTDFVFDQREVQQSYMGADSMYDMESYMGGSMEMGMGSGMGANRRGARNANSNDPMEQLVKKLLEGSEDPKKQEALIREWITQRASVEGELLLFRYLDFSVEPGKTYRYRVRLVLNNPNYGRRIAEAGGMQHVVEGQTRTTEWSDPTDPVRIDEDVKYFVADVRNPRRNPFPSARMDVFQYDTEHGTTINETFEVAVGQQIADEVNATTVIDPAQQLFEEMEYVFHSDDYLVDTIEDIEIDEAFHGGDQVPAEFKLEMMRGVHDRLALKGSLLVRDKDEGLKVRDPMREQTEHDSMKKYMELQANAFQYIKDAQKTPELGGEYADLYGEGGGEMYMGMGYEGETGGPRGRNVLRRSSRGGASGRAEGGRRARGSGGGY